MTFYGILKNSQEQSSKTAVTDRRGAIMVRVLKPPSRYNAKTDTPSKYKAKTDSQKNIAVRCTVSSVAKPTVTYKLVWS